MFFSSRDFSRSLQKFSSIIWGSPLIAQKSIQRIRDKREILIPGHDRLFRQRERKIEFIEKINWLISADLHPDEKAPEILKLNYG